MGVSVLRTRPRVPSGGSGNDKPAEKRFCRWAREGRYGGNHRPLGAGLNALGGGVFRLNAGNPGVMGGSHCHYGNARCCPIWTPSRAKLACPSGYRPSWRKPALCSPISGSARIAPSGSGHPMSPQIWGHIAGPVCSRCCSVAAGARAAPGVRQGSCRPKSEGRSGGGRHGTDFVRGGRWCRMFRTGTPSPAPYSKAR